MLLVASGGSIVEGLPGSYGHAVTLATASAVVGAVVAFAVQYMYYSRAEAAHNRTATLQGKHVVITGGTEGIGLSLLKLCVATRQPRTVSILARSLDKFASAMTALDYEYVAGSSTAVSSSTSIYYVKCDVQDEVSICAAFEEVLQHTGGCIDMLMNCAGLAICDVAENLTNAEYKRVVNTNLLGTIICTKQVLPVMQSQRSGTICITSSQAGQLGLYGYSAYSASKFGLVGYAQALAMELSPFNIHVAVAYPPDVETPGYATEGKRKPDITKQIASTSGITQSDDVATKILDDLDKGVSRIVFGFEGRLLDINTSGFNPPDGILRTIFEIYFVGLSRIAALYLWFNWTRMLTRHEETTHRLVTAAINSKKKATGTNTGAGTDKAVRGAAGRTNENAEPTR